MDYLKSLKAVELTYRCFSDLNSLQSRCVLHNLSRWCAAGARPVWRWGALRQQSAQQDRYGTARTAERYHIALLIVVEPVDHRVLFIAGIVSNRHGVAYILRSLTICLADFRKAPDVPVPS
jgi:hypothetical protein